MNHPYILPHAYYGGVLYVAYPKFVAGAGHAGWYKIAAYYGSNPKAYNPEFFDDRAKKSFVEVNGGEVFNNEWLPYGCSAPKILGKEPDIDDEPSESFSEPLEGPRGHDGGAE
jgi:hypothetical protein